MTQAEVENQNLRVEDVLARKRKVRVKAIDGSAKNAQVSATTYRKGQAIINHNPPEELLNKLRLGEISIPKAYRQLENLQRRRDLLSNAVISNVEFPDNIQLIEGNFIEKCALLHDSFRILVYSKR